MFKFQSFIPGRKRVVRTLIALPILFIGWLMTASLQGWLDAQFDVAFGHYEEQGYGLPVAWMPRYAQLMHDRYGIQYRAVAGCLVSESLVSYVHSYNQVSEAAANRKFGHDVFKEIAEEAAKEWERTREEQR